ncbi:MAG TPA: DegT/DnrJ/EryC1/StrS aminotransferase family protein [Xanthobacteraceae bacterium]|nr:DegT/DnrJ/EryC1/StrS aminotransferase family protein [Xanthobacteraceae bacterium]
MTSEPSLAMFRGTPRFRGLLPVGQYYWPTWERYEQAARDIFLRRFYTSQRFAGPLVIRFQQQLQEFLGVKHVVAVRNAASALMIVTHSLGLRGKVIVPSWASMTTIQSLRWSKCQPVFCDIDPQSQQICLESLRQLLGRGEIEGILGVHLWGNALPVRELEMLAAQYGVALYQDASHAFGCRVNDKAIGTFGRAEAFSFHAANILSTAEGGCITTNDDALAAHCTAMRGDHVSAQVWMQSATARMSEIQAAIGLMMLDDFEQNRERNGQLHRSYERYLSDIPGITILKPSGATVSNFQNFVGVIDPSKFGLTRDNLLAVLQAENIAAERHFHSPGHLAEPYPERLENTEFAMQRTFQLPIGARVTIEQIEQICEVISEAYRHSEFVRSVLTARAVG